MIQSSSSYCLRFVGGVGLTALVVGACGAVAVDGPGGGGTEPEPVRLAMVDVGTVGCRFCARCVPGLATVDICAGDGLRFADGVLVPVAGF